jgi:hypothetical protein
MGGMPSARGCEWKGRYDEAAHKKFQEAFEKIPKNPDGTMMVEPTNREFEVSLRKPPTTCNECKMIIHCPTECGHGSEGCRTRLGI